MKRPNLPTHLLLKILLVFVFLGGAAHCFPDQGRWPDFQLTKGMKFSSDCASMDKNVLAVSKSLFKDSSVYLQIVCNATAGTGTATATATATAVNVDWSLWESSCWERYLLYGAGNVSGNTLLPDNTSRMVNKTSTQEYECNGHIILKKEIPGPEHGSQKLGVNDPVYTVPADGMYLFVLSISVANHQASDTPFSANVGVKMVASDGGYLSAADWPLLPFYGAMCLIYVIFGMAWLVVSFLQWRDLLRIQFWISGVILLGMLEKALFYAEYQEINSTGYSLQSAVLFAELVSCAKRTLARMLVVIVSLGFGIVKPRLGPMLHRVVACGMLYFLLASVECYKRVFTPKNDPDNKILLASMPLALLDSAFCWWIFSNLVQTLRTLRLRRNLVKLSLYRHFSTALIFSIVASVIFMLYSIKMHRITHCLLDWRSLWVDEAYWHIQFSVLLLIIMILWRPANNNQRYAFSPLLDNPEDEDEEEDQFVNDAYGLKMRGGNTRSNSPNPKSSTSAEEDLKWVEDNIPASILDHALPVLDSDEEIMTTKFEISKMQ